MSDLFTLRPAREGDWELINYYAYRVGRALIDDARAHHDEIRLVARGTSIEFYRVLGFIEIPWDDIAPGVTEECDGCPLIEECGPLPMGWKREGA